MYIPTSYSAFLIALCFTDVSGFFAQSLLTVSYVFATNATLGLWLQGNVPLPFDMLLSLYVLPLVFGFQGASLARIWMKFNCKIHTKLLRESKRTALRSSLSTRWPTLLPLISIIPYDFAFNTSLFEYAWIFYLATILILGGLTLAASKLLVDPSEDEGLHFQESYEASRLFFVFCSGSALVMATWMFDFASTAASSFMTQTTVDIALLTSFFVVQNVAQLFLFMNLRTRTRRSSTVSLRDSRTEVV